MENPGEPNPPVKTVVVIDDHIMFREGLINLFRFNTDFKVVGEAGSVQEGIQQARLHHPNIILMDFSLPDGTGLEATETILAELPDCKIVFLTVHETDEKLIAALRLGAAGYMLKNISSSNLIASLRGLGQGEKAVSRKMLSQAMDVILLGNSPEAVKSDLLTKLSPREMEVLCELESNASNLEIAERLFLSENTVKHHLQNVYNKLGVKNRRQAALFARKNGLRSKFSTTRRV